MDRSPAPDAIEHAIHDNFPMLRFSSDLERRFEADTSVSRCRTLRRLNLIGLGIFHLFLIGDYHIFHDVLYLNLFVHFGVCTPIFIIVHAVLKSNPPVWLREGLQIVALSTLAAMVLSVFAASASPYRDISHLALAVIVLFTILMQRVRFWYVVVFCLVMLAMNVVASLAMTPFLVDRAIISTTFLTGLILLSLVGAYHLEHEHRMSYLLRLRDACRNRQLEIVSLRDALTGIGNRRALDSAFERLVDATSTAPSRPTAILLLDIDRFKQFNDLNGHQEGDACLRRVASLIGASLREGEGEAYRFGGEEFLVLLDHATLDEAVAVAERVRSAVEEARLPSDLFAKAIVTVSIGVASGHLGRGILPETLVAAADGALYEAKRAGRNCVRAAGDRRREPVPVLGEPRLAS